MSTEQWRVGDVTITKIDEFITIAPPEVWQSALTGATLEEVDAIDWLKPTYVTPDDEFVTSIHSFLVQTPSKRIIIDTGVGNDRTRAVGMFNMLSNPYLERIEEFGWSPASVDGVVCTHLHIDHVGWNTRLADGKWVPTFPNAEYFFTREEYDHWKKYSETPRDPNAYTQWAYDMVDGVAVFNDSIRPIAEAGLISWVPQGGSITPEVSFLPTPGHTPGHMSIVIESQGEKAVITGDMMHFVCQVARPDWSPTLDTDLLASAVTRNKFVHNFADTGTLVLGTHFPTPSGGYIITEADSHRFVPATTVTP